MSWIRERWNRLLSALLALATIFALIPYEAGWLSTLYPAAWKPWILLCGTISTLVSQLFGRKKEVPQAPSVIQNFYTYNITTMPPKL